MDNRPRNPTPDSGSPYKKTHPVLRSSISHKTFPRQNPDTGFKRPNDSNDPDTDSEPEYNLYDESSRSRDPVHRSPCMPESLDGVELGVTNNSCNRTASASVDTQPAPPRQFRATDSGSPVRQSEAYRNSSNSTIEPKQRRIQNRRLLEIYTDPSPDTEETAKISNKRQQLPAAPIHFMHTNPQPRTIDDDKGKESNKENIPPETIIPLEEGVTRSRPHPRQPGANVPPRPRHRHRRPLGLLNPSDFYPVDASMCLNCSGNGTGTGVSNLRTNGDDGDVFLGGSGDRWASWGRIRCLRCWK
ncbi:hypothetical protein EMCG_04364 [[Emmonsia] crescens]|uniref:Uncharacterized protein n=1 Tax=[Emmonsia] crescens TaxID=73230 RepID=A0A0G2HS99_9EURO|nr:hypothetical protein EMCG_04364 [Emmonsia crescens UAMH 3008]